MYVINLEQYGHLTDSESYSTEHKHNDLYEIFNNRLDWERKYIHPNYSAVLKAEYSVEQPCPDVYWFPIVTETFCRHLVEEMEHFGKWSSGTNTVSNPFARVFKLHAFWQQRQLQLFNRSGIKKEKSHLTSYFRVPGKLNPNSIGLRGKSKSKKVSYN